MPQSKTKKKRSQKGDSNSKKSYRAYFSPHEEILVRAIADTFKVSMGQFIKGAAVEMARATMEMATTKQEQETSNDDT